MMAISGLNHTARSLAVYASQCRLPGHHARLAPGRWPGSAGRGWLPAGSHRKVSARASPFPKLSWRTEERFIIQALRSLSRCGGQCGARSGAPVCTFGLEYEALAIRDDNVAAPAS